MKKYFFCLIFLYRNFRSFGGRSWSGSNRKKRVKKI